MRKHSGGWVAKILMGLLVISFAVWGVADIFGGYRSQALVTVGDTEVNAEDFRFAFQREMQQVGRQFGTSISLDQARTIGLDRRVLGRMITEATLDNDANERGLGISDQAIARSITRDPSFQDASGNFNRTYFEQVLRSNGLTEARYIASERERHLRQQIATAIGTTGEPPRLLLEAVHRFQNEERTIDYITINAGMIDTVGAPAEADLTEYFEGNKARFRAPETRKIEIIDVTPEKLAQSVEVSEDDIAASYEAHSDQYQSAEKREIHQIVFPSMEEAEAASQRIKTGAGFAAIAEERGLSQADLSLGRVEKSAMIDKGVAEAAFGLREGQVSEPVKTALGAVIVKVIDVEPATTKTLDAARDEIRKELAREQAEAKVLDIYDAVEDERASGAPFSDIAAKLKLSYRVIAAIDAQGRDAEGNQIADLPAASDVVSLTFDSDPGLELDAIHTTGGGFVWLNVLDVTPERERALDEVRDKVVEAWREGETAHRLAAKANELLEKAKKGEALEAIATEVGAGIETSKPLKRGSTSEALSPAAIQNAFAVPQGGYAASTHTNGKDRVLLRVAETSVPPFDPDGEATRQIVDGVASSISNSLLSAYIGARQEHFGVSINEQTLRAALGER